MPKALRTRCQRRRQRKAWGRMTSPYQSRGLAEHRELPRQVPGGAWPKTILVSLYIMAGSRRLIITILI